jgi:hypothetical protein
MTKCSSVTNVDLIAAVTLKMVVTNVDLIAAVTLKWLVTSTTSSSDKYQAQAVAVATKKKLPEYYLAWMIK